MASGALKLAWAILADRYSAEWTDENGHEWDGKRWLVDCGQLTLEQVEYGCNLDAQRVARSVAQGFRAKPPDSATFRAMCLSMPTRTRPPPIDRTGKRSERMRQVWLAYREKFGLAKKRTLTDDEIEHALDGVDIDAMHDEVRAIRRKNMPRVPASRPDEWPFHISSTEKRGVIYTRNEYGAIQRYATPRTPRDGAEQ